MRIGLSRCGTLVVPVHLFCTDCFEEAVVKGEVRMFVPLLLPAPASSSSSNNGHTMNGKECEPSCVPALLGFMADERGRLPC